MTLKGDHDFIERFIHKDINGAILFIYPDERRAYAERMMYFHIGVAIACLNVNEMPFYKLGFGSVVRARASDLGERVLDALAYAENSRIFGLEDGYLRTLKLNPILMLTYRVFSAATDACGGHVDGVGFVEPVVFNRRIYKNALGIRMHRAVDGLNKLLLQLKTALTTDALREEIKNFRRNSKERYFQLMKVASQAWEVNCKNVLIRIDWAFRKAHPPLPPRFKTENEIKKEFLVVENKRKLILKRLKIMYGKDLVFFAWKIECGYSKGLHMHWLLALNGSKYQDAWFHSSEIVKDLNEHVCGDDSYALNVRGIKKDGRPSLRNIDYRDEDLPGILDRYASYLTKLDVTMKLRAPESLRTFGCSKIRKINLNKPGPKRGR